MTGASAVTISLFENKFFISLFNKNSQFKLALCLFNIRIEKKNIVQTIDGQFHCAEIIPPYSISPAADILNC